MRNSSFNRAGINRAESKAQPRKLKSNPKQSTGVLRRIANSVHTQILRWGLGASMLTAAACGSGVQDPKQDATESADVVSHPDTYTIGDITVVVDEDGQVTYEDGQVIEDQDVLEQIKDIIPDPDQADSGPTDVGPMAGSVPWFNPNKPWALPKVAGATILENYPQGYVDPINGQSDECRVAIEVPDIYKPKAEDLTKPVLEFDSALTAIINAAPFDKDPSSFGDRHIATADVDGDGDQDLIAHAPHANGGGTSPYIFKVQNGELQPHEPASWMAGDGGNCSTAADFNNDGHDDLSCIQWTNQGDEVRLYWGAETGLSSGDFSLISDFPYFYTTTASDLNGDGQLDMLLANISTQGYEPLVPNQLMINDNIGDRPNFNSALVFTGPHENSFHEVPWSENSYKPLHTPGSRPISTAHNDGAAEQFTKLINVQPDGTIQTEEYNPFDPNCDRLNYVFFAQNGVSTAIKRTLRQSEIDQMKPNFGVGPLPPLDQFFLSSAHGPGDTDPMGSATFDIAGNMFRIETHTGAPVPGAITFWVDPETGQFVHIPRLNQRGRLAEKGGIQKCWGITEIPTGSVSKSTITACGEDKAEPEFDGSLGFMMSFLDSSDTGFAPGFTPLTTHGTAQVHSLGPDFTMELTSASFETTFNEEGMIYGTELIPGSSGFEAIGDYVDAAKVVIGNDIYIILSKFHTRDITDKNIFEVYRVVQQGHRAWLAIDTERPGVPRNGHGAVLTITAQTKDGEEFVSRSFVGGSNTRINAGNTLSTPVFAALGGPELGITEFNAEVCWPGGQTVEACTSYTDLKAETMDDHERGPGNPHILE